MLKVQLKLITSTNITTLYITDMFKSIQKNLNRGYENEFIQKVNDIMMLIYVVHINLY